MVADRPILFSGPLVRAILDGRKTVTRRPCKSSVVETADGHVVSPGPKGTRLVSSLPTPEEQHREMLSRCPYGEPGDRLWVRETHAVVGDPPTVAYRADLDASALADEAEVRRIVGPGWTRWTPSIHMPRWASRLTLRVTDVRVERLQDITEDDARLEGARRFPDLPGPDPYGSAPRWSMRSPSTTEECLGSARMAFANAWGKAYGPGSWAANGWVWRVAFEVVRG